jgi:cytosine deaminase
VSTLLLTGVRPLGGPARDLLVSDGRIAQVGERLAAPEDATVVDGRGHLAVPGLVDAHAHLDKTLWGLPWRPHSAGDGLAALIDNEHRGRAELRRQGVTVAQRAGALLGAYVATGTSHIRSHVDVDTAAGLDSLHGVLEARDAHADRVDVSSSPSPRAACWSVPEPPSCWRRPSGPAPTWSAASTRPASTTGRSSTWTPSSPSPAGTAAASTSTCTTAASWARSPST